MTTKPFILTAQDRDRLRRTVLQYIFKGRRNAVRGKDLARQFGQPDDRKIRLVIRELISEGVPVASAVFEPMGFYIVANEHEAADYIRVLKERIKENTARLRDFEKAASQFNIPEQGALL
jgi:hypothetical protein